MKKKYILILILFLVVGFASISTTLIINGIIGVGVNTFDVFFSGAILNGVDESNILIKDKKTIVFETNKLSMVGDTADLVYEVTNNSTHYDALVNISCSLSNEVDFIKVDLDKATFEIKSGKIDTGEITITLTKPIIDDGTLSLTCILDVEPIERTELGEEAPIVGDYAIIGYFVNEDKEPIANAYLAVYSEVKHIVKTDLYGYFYVEGLERGLHEIYYLNDLNPMDMSKQEIIDSQKSEVYVGTNHVGEIIFKNNYKIVDSYIINTKDKANKKYNITFDTDGGVLSETTYEVEENKLYGDLPTPEKTGYNFLGWYKDDKFINKDVMVVDDYTHTLKAKYEAEKYQITFNANGGSLSESDLTKEVTFDTLIGNLPSPTRENFNFLGWYKEEDLITKIDNNTIYDFAENITLYAGWMPEYFAITYDLDGGSLTETNKEEYSYDDNDFTLSNPTRVNYRFVGWTGSNGDEPQVTVTIPKGSIGDKTYKANWVSTCLYTAGSVVKDFTYRGSVEEYSLPCAGTYKLEVWGAQGGASVCNGSYNCARGGYGGYATGTIALSTGRKLYVAVGGAGCTPGFNESSCGGWNGGGNGSGDKSDDEASGGGGGATHIAVDLNKGVLANYNSYRSNVLIVAGGGGGASWYTNGNSGGGTGGSYAFGQGQTGNGSGGGSNGMPGGGGGWSGGYNGNGNDSGGQASGGSGYIGGVSNGSMSNGARSGNGYAKITLISID